MNEEKKVEEKRRSCVERESIECVPWNEVAEESMGWLRFPFEGFSSFGSMQAVTYPMHVCACVSGTAGKKEEGGRECEGKCACLCLCVCPSVCVPQRDKERVHQARRNETIQNKAKLPLIQSRSRTAAHYPRVKARFKDILSSPFYSASFYPSSLPPTPLSAGLHLHRSSTYV